MGGTGGRHLTLGFFWVVLTHINFITQTHTQLFITGQISLYCESNLLEEKHSMAKSIENVMRGVPPEKQISGMTENEIRTEFTLNGYGVTKANKRVNELQAAAIIQSDGTKRGGEFVFFCAWWPWSAQDHIDFDRICGVEYMDARHTILRRLDKKSNPMWLQCSE